MPDFRSWTVDDLLVLARAAGQLWDSTGRSDPYDVLNDRQRRLLDLAAMGYLTAGDQPAESPPVRIRQHKGYGHGLRPGDTYDMNCPSCQREQAEDALIPYEDSTVHDGDDSEPWDNSASSLLPTDELMNPAHPEDAVYYDEHQVAYIVRQLSPGDPAGTHGPLRVLTSYGRLRGWTLDTEHKIRHDQSDRDLGLWLITGIRNCKTGWYAGDIPDRPLRHWVFK